MYMILYLMKYYFVTAQIYFQLVVHSFDFEAGIMSVSINNLITPY